MFRIVFVLAVFLVASPLHAGIIILEKSATSLDVRQAPQRLVMEIAGGPSGGQGFARLLGPTVNYNQPVTWEIGPENPAWGTIATILQLPSTLPNLPHWGISWGHEVLDGGQVGMRVVDTFGGGQFVNPLGLSLEITEYIPWLSGARMSGTVRIWGDEYRGITTPEPSTWLLALTLLACCSPPIIRQNCRMIYRA